MSESKRAPSRRSSATRVPNAASAGYKNPEHNLLAPTRAALMRGAPIAAQQQWLLRLSERVGNAQVVLAIGQIGRVPAPEIVPAAAAPGLSEDIYAQLKGLLAAKKRQEALDDLVTYLANDGRIDLDLLDEKKMHYSPGTAGEGATSPAGFKRDPVTKEWKSKPTLVRIGPDAFKADVTLLYTTVMHEYQHVLQMQENVAKETKGQRSLGWLIERQEVEAYALEIINGEDTGLLQQPKLLKATWERLHNEHWVHLGRASRAVPDLKDKYTQAYELASKTLGDKVKLPVDAKAIK